MKQILCLLPALLALTACKSNPEKTAQQARSTIRLYASREPVSLDPRIGGERASQTFLRQLFDGLMRPGADGKPEPSVAEQVDVSSDGCTYRFAMKKTNWSNGEPVTAHDFAYAWKSVITPGFPSGFSYAFAFIKNAHAASLGQCSIEDVGIRVIDDYTIEVELAHPAPYFLDLVANCIYSPVCKKQVEQFHDCYTRGGDAYVCNGPFVLRDWKHQVEIVMEKNPAYTAQEVKADIIVTSIIEDPQTALTLYENGEIDWVGQPFGSLPLDAIPTLRDANQLETRNVGQIFWYQFNTQHPLLGSKKIRNAFARAINRHELTDHLLQGGEQPVFSILPDSITQLTQAPFRDNDVETARVLFAEGLVEVGLTPATMPSVRLCHYSDPGDKAIAVAVQQQLQAALGVTVELSCTDWANHLKRIDSSDFDIAGLGWFSWYQDPLYNLEVLKHKTQAFNGARWEHPEFTRLLDASDAEADPVKRLELLRQAEVLVMEEMPFCPVFSNTYKFAKSPSLQGELITPIGHLDLKNAQILSRNK